MLLPLRLEPFGPEHPRYLEGIAVYARTWGRDCETARAYFDSFALSPVQYPGWLGLLALEGETVVGVGFGTRSQRGQWWYDAVEARLGPGHWALRNAWVLTELAVRAESRRFGVGEQLLTALLERQPCPRALLSTQQTNLAAQRFYLRHGWQLLARDLRFCGGHTPFVIMGRELRPSPAS
ncbi:GNAT superfamily N-acetyltransferase [Deinobacterium chartae]|uniref:GNAT superfamily N-acetyltransferase n=1 Tax=Deinobacterium chartae TaxID=521158 RepID=A0A841HYA3_9DEIO|nr:GNAT family N-acetyltransferase [Deinobacterium chartae]MBB6098521.1 GNAT superfamily N-acetyltransferase [Deinobacterium chartae]